MITQFKIYEIADSSIDLNTIESNIVDSFVSINQSVFTLKIKDLIYRVDFRCLGNVDGTALQIDFGAEKDGEYSNALTNKGDALFVLANIIGLIKYYLSFPHTLEQSYSGQIVNFKDINIVSFIIAAKSEETNDDRRKNIYDYYIEKNFKQMGIQIKNKINITEEYEKKFNIKDMLVTKYRINPIKIGEISKRI